MVKKVLISMPSEDEHKLYVEFARLHNDSFSAFAVDALREKYNRDSLRTRYDIDPLELIKRNK